MGVSLTGPRVRKFALAACLALSLFAALHFVSMILQYPYVGIYTDMKGSRVITEYIAPYSWAKQAGIQPGERVLSIDGQPAFANRNVVRYGEIEQARSVTLMRGHKALSLKVEKGESGSALLYYLIIPAVFFLMCFAMGCFLYTRQQKNRAVPVLIAFMAVAGIMLLEVGANTRQDEWSLRLTVFSMLYGHVLMMHFLRKYFASWSLFFMSKLSLVFLYLAASFIFIYSMLFSEKEINAGYPLELIFSAAVFVMMCIQTIRLYIRVKKTEYRKIVQILMAGFFLSLCPFAILYALPLVAFGVPVTPLEWTLPFLIFMPMTLFYLVISKFFIDISFIIGRLAYYGGLSLLATVLILSGFLSVMYRSMGWNPIEAARMGICTLIVVLFLLYSKEYLDYYLRKRLFPKRQDFQTSLNRFLKWSKTEYNMSDFVFILQQEAENCLPVEKAMLVKIDAAGRPVSLLNDEVPLPHVLRRLINALPPSGMFIENADGFAAFLMNRDGDMIVLTGKWKKPRRLLNLDERVWLETLLNYAQLVIENLYKTEEMMDAFKHLETNRRSLSMTTKKFIFKISERERRQLSRDLHDTNLQDQLSVARDIDVEKKKMSDPAVVYFLENIRERILDNVHVLRKVINDLRPDFIQRLGLVKSLDILFEQINLRSSFVLHEQIEEGLMIDDKEIEIAVYRIIQELLNNAMKHSKAAHVHLSLTQEGRWYVLDYLDDGIGIDLNQLDRSFSTMGIPGMIGRAEGLSGKITLESGKESGKRKGLHVVVRLPKKSSEEN